MVRAPSSEQYRAQRLADPSSFQPSIMYWDLNNDPSGKVLDLDEPLRVKFRVLWSRNRIHDLHFGWVSEETMHYQYRDKVLEYWDMKGGRDAQIRQVIGELDKDRPYLVHKIVQDRVVSGRRQYLVEWVGYEHPTWQDGNALPGSLVQDFRKQKNRRRRRARK